MSDDGRDELDIGREPLVLADELDYAGRDDLETGLQLQALVARVQAARFSGA